MGAPGVRSVMWEEQMLAEYLAAFHRGERTLQRVRLGPIEIQHSDPLLSEPERRMLGAVFRRWADALVIAPGSLTLVEASMVADVGDISKLGVYRRLLPSTPELAQWLDRPVRSILVWAVDDPYARQVAVEQKIEVRIFKPSNFSEWLTAKRKREAEPRKLAPLPQG